MDTEMKRLSFIISAVFSALFVFCVFAVPPVQLCPQTDGKVVTQQLSVAQVLKMWPSSFTTNAAGELEEVSEYLDAETMSMAAKYRVELADWGGNETNDPVVNADIIATNPTNTDEVVQWRAVKRLVWMRQLLREAGYGFDFAHQGSNKVTETTR
jgi:hypothetical protein